MLRTILIVVLVALFFSSIAAAHTLDQYPRFFLDEDDRPDIVVGDRAPASDVVQAALLAMPLQQQAKKYRTKIPPAKLASELRSTNRNIILLGTVCQNKAIPRVLHARDCNPYQLEAGEAIIALHHDNGKHQLIITAADADALSQAVHLLLREENALSGSEIKLSSGRVVKPMPRRTEQRPRATQSVHREEAKVVHSRSREEPPETRSIVQQRLSELDAFLTKLRDALEGNTPSQQQQQVITEGEQPSAEEEEVILVRFQR